MQRKTIVSLISVVLIASVMLFAGCIMGPEPEDTAPGPEPELPEEIESTEPEPPEEIYPTDPESEIWEVNESGEQTFYLETGDRLDFGDGYLLFISEIDIDNDTVFIDILVDDREVNSIILNSSQNSSQRSFNFSYYINMENMIEDNDTNRVVLSVELDYLSPPEPAGPKPESEDSPSFLSITSTLMIICGYLYLKKYNK